jgi:methionyl-tRNA formyltransferase
VRTLDGIEDGVLVPVPQPSDGVSHAPKITTEDARVRWEHPALAVDRRIRACTPAPGAWTTVAGARLGLGPVTTWTADNLLGPDLVLRDKGLAPGEVLVRRREVLVGTATDIVRLSVVVPAGRKPMPASDWARGARLEPGTVLGVPQ